MMNVRIGIAMLAASCFIPAMADQWHPDKQGVLVAAADAMAQGEIRKVDKDGGRLTIRHGPIPNLDMPPMTMVFRVKDPAMLDRVKVGDKIRFEAAKDGGNYTVMRLEAVK